MQNTIQKIKYYYRLLGPGILCAGAAIGVSHLVQSTRAGGQYGFQLLWVVVVANLIKYPFFEIGPRYTTVMKESLLEGYSRLGRWPLVVVLIMTVATMFTIQAAITLVTAGIVVNVLGLAISAKMVSVFLLMGCSLLLIIGKYSILDNFVKVIMIVLAISTIASLLGAFSIDRSSIVNSTSSLLRSFDWNNKIDLFFLVGLAGWMPAPLDLSVWHSLWVREKSKTEKNSGDEISLKNSLLDFRVGYIGTALLAMAFLSLGALTMYGGGEEVASSAGGFAAQLIRIYTSSLGNWAYPVIALAAFATMLSTTLTCLDAFPRVLNETLSLLFSPEINPVSDEKIKEKPKMKLYSLWLIVISLGTVILLYYFIGNMKEMVALATTISFVLAPVYAILNYLIMQDSRLPAEGRLDSRQKFFCIIGIIVLLIFSAWFLNLRYFNLF